jgi:hypothetical protein
MTTPSIITWRSKSNTGLIDILIDVDSKGITAGIFVVYEKDTAIEAEIILSTEASTVSNSDNAQSRSVMFVASLDVGRQNIY